MVDIRSSDDDDNDAGSGSGGGSAGAERRRQHAGDDDVEEERVLEYSLRRQQQHPHRRRRRRRRRSSSSRSSSNSVDDGDHGRIASSRRRRRSSASVSTGEPSSAAAAVAVLMLAVAAGTASAATLPANAANSVPQAPPIAVRGESAENDNLGGGGGADDEESDALSLSQRHRDRRRIGEVRRRRSPDSSTAGLPANESATSDFRRVWRRRKLLEETGGGTGAMGSSSSSSRNVGSSVGDAASGGDGVTATGGAGGNTGSGFSATNGTAAGTGGEDAAAVAKADNGGRGSDSTSAADGANAVTKALGNSNNATLVAMMREIEGADDLREASAILQDFNLRDVLDKYVIDSAEVDEMHNDSRLDAIPHDGVGSLHGGSAHVVTSSFWSAFVVVAVHVMFLVQWKSSRSRRRRSYSSTWTKRATSVSYRTLVDRKQLFRVWLPLLSHPIAQRQSSPHTPPPEPSRTATERDEGGGSGTATSTASLPMGSEDADDIERRLQRRRYYHRESNGGGFGFFGGANANRVLEFVRRTWYFLAAATRTGVLEFQQQHQYNRLAVSSVLLLIYNSHLVWSCRALEAYYYHRSISLSNKSLVSGFLAYPRVLVSLACMAVGSHAYLVHRLGEVAGKLGAVAAAAATSEETRTALREQGFTTESLKQFRTLVLRKRSVATFTVIPCALIVVFGHAFPHVPLQVLPFIKNPSWFVDPAVTFAIAFIIEMVLVRNCSSKGGNTFRRNATSTTANGAGSASMPASNLGSRAALSTANGGAGATANGDVEAGTGGGDTNGAETQRGGSSERDLERRDDDSTSYGYFYVFSGVLSGSLWSLGMEFLSEPYWGNGFLILLVLFSLLSAKTDKYWTKYMACVDYVAFDRHALLRIPGVDEPQPWAMMQRSFGRDFGTADHVDGRSDGDDDDSSSSSSSGSISGDDIDGANGSERNGNAATSTAALSHNRDWDDEVQRAYPRLDDEEIYGLLPDLGDMDIEDGGVDDAEEGVPLTGVARRRGSSPSRSANVRSRRGGGTVTAATDR